MWPFKKEKEILVATITIDVQTIINKEKGTVFIYLYETESGKRREERQVSIHDASTEVQGLETYWAKVYPWLQGVNSPDIPYYWEKVHENNKYFIKTIYKRLTNG